jgi:hypothetical protein
MQSLKQVVLVRAVLKKLNGASYLQRNEEWVAAMLILAEISWEHGIADVSGR